MDRATIAEILLKIFREQKQDLAVNDIALQDGRIKYVALFSFDYRGQRQTRDRKAFDQTTCIDGFMVYFIVDPEIHAFLKRHAALLNGPEKWAVWRAALIFVLYVGKSNQVDIRHEDHIGHYQRAVEFLSLPSETRGPPPNYLIRYIKMVQELQGRVPQIVAIRAKFKNGGPSKIGNTVENVINKTVWKTYRMGKRIEPELRNVLAINEEGNKVTEDFLAYLETLELLEGLPKQVGKEISLVLLDMLMEKIWRKKCKIMH